MLYDILLRVATISIVGFQKLSSCLSFNNLAKQTRSLLLIFCSHLDLGVSEQPDFLLKSH